MLSGWIGRIVAALGITGCILTGTILFYEGVFLLNWWPANKIPYAGWLIEGEVNRRTEMALDEARRKDALRKATKRREAERSLGEQEAVRLERERQKRLKLEGRLDALNAAIDTERQRAGAPPPAPLPCLKDNQDAEPPRLTCPVCPACNGLREPVPGSIRMQLDAIR